MTAVICAVVIGVAGYALYQQMAATYHWGKAQQAIASHDFDAAKTHLAYCLKVWPSSYETHFVLARTCRRAGDYESAWKHLRQAEKLRYAVLEELDLEQLLLKAQEGRVREVEGTLQDYLKRPQDHETFSLILEALARGYYGTYRLQEADRWLSVWVKHDADSWAPYYWRGKTLETNFQPAHAVGEYRAALERRPGHAETTLRLAESLLATGLHPEALPYFEQYLQLKPDDPSGLAGVARCQYSLGQPQAAQARLSRLLALYPNHAGALHLQALLLQDQDRLKEALALLRTAKRLAPHELDITFSLAKVLRALGQNDEALKQEQEGERFTKDSRRLRGLMDKVLADPHNADLRYEVGATLMSVGQEFGGTVWLLTALQEDPKHAPSHKLLADYFEKNGDKKSADYHRRRAGGGEKAAARPANPEG